MTKLNISSSNKEYICVGAFAGAHGIRGTVRLKSFTQDPLEFFNFETVYTEEEEREFHFLRGSPKGDGFYISQVREITTREDAESLKNQRLYVKKSQLPSVQENEFYHKDLIGLDVYLEDDQKIGDVVSVHNFGANDIITVKREGDLESVMLPFTHEMFPRISLEHRTLTVQKDLWKSYQKIAEEKP